MNAFLGLFIVALVCSESALAAGEANRKVRQSKESGTTTTENEPSRESHLFPDWPAASFDWFFGPVVAFRYQSISADNASKVTSTTFEGGLGAGLVGIPVVKGNPGWVLGTDAGMAYGYAYNVVTAAEQPVQKFGTHFTRQWVGVGSTVYVRYFRYHLDVRSAKLTPKEDPDGVIHSQKIGNDFGILILPWLSEHYSVNYLRAYTDSYSHKFIEDYDHWLHTRMAFDFMSFLVDVGPGFTQTTEFAPATGSELAKGRTDYLLLKTGINPFWKLVADGQAKYVYNASEERLGTYGATRLPEDDLNEAPTLAMPEDSFLGSFFFGVKDIAYGIGAGWRTNIQVLNVNRHDGAQKKTTKTQGLGLYAEARF